MLPMGALFKSKLWGNEIKTVTLIYLQTLHHISKKKQKTMLLSPSNPSYQY